MDKKKHMYGDYSDNTTAIQQSNFLISVYRTEHQSYQGIIQWLDGGKTLHFRSELELLTLIQEAVGSKKEITDLRSWKDTEPGLKSVK